MRGDGGRGAGAGERGAHGLGVSSGERVIEMEEGHGRTNDS